LENVHWDTDKIYILEKGCDVWGLKKLAQDRVQWWALVCAVLVEPSALIAPSAANTPLTFAHVMRRIAGDISLSLKTQRDCSFIVIIYRSNHRKIPHTTVSLELRHKNG
jgi:hypothetical protein